MRHTNALRYSTAEQETEAPKAMTTDELIEDVRNMEIDHEPDGYPAVRMRDVSALADEIERLREALRYALLREEP